MKLIFLPVFVVLFFVSCTSTPVKRNFSEVIDDSVISNRLKVKYLKDDQVSGFGVNIDTFKGVVTLKGQLGDQSQIDRAIAVAEREEGVKQVKSYLYIDKDQRSQWLADEKKGTSQYGQAQRDTSEGAATGSKKITSAGGKKVIEETDIGR